MSYAGRALPPEDQRDYPGRAWSLKPMSSSGAFSAFQPRARAATEMATKKQRTMSYGSTPVDDPPAARARE